MTTWLGLFRFGEHQTVNGACPLPPCRVQFPADAKICHAHRSSLIVHCASLTATFFDTRPVSIQSLAVALSFELDLVAWRIDDIAGCAARTARDRSARRFTASLLFEQSSHCRPPRSCHALVVIPKTITSLQRRLFTRLLPRHRHQARRRQSRRLSLPSIFLRKTRSIVSRLP